MDLIRNILVNKKLFDSIEEVDKYLEEVGAHEGSIVQSLMFDAEVFETSAEVMEWSSEHGFGDRKPEESKSVYNLTIFDISEFNEDTIKDIEIRRGVKAKIGVIKAPVAETHYLSLRNDEGIKLSSDVPHIIELAKVVSGTHAVYGPVEITKDMLKNFVRNFEENVVGVELMIDFDHETKEAAGWLRSLFLNFDEDVLLGEVRWTPKGALALSDREFRYFSPEFTQNYIHPHTGEENGPTLMGGALVNRPFLKMEAIVSLKNKGESEMKDMISLKDHEDKITSLNEKIEEYKLSEEKVKGVVEGLKSENTKLSEDNEKLSSEIKTMNEDAEKKAFEVKIEKMFADNKINAAQLQALKDGKDLMEVLELNAQLNATPKGKDGSNDTVDLEEAEKAMCDKLGLTPEEYKKYSE